MVTVISDERYEIVEFLAEYCRVTDAGDYEAWADLFTPDGSFVLLGETHTGPDELLPFILQDQPPEKRGLHFSVNPSVTVSGSTARAQSDFLFIAITKAGPEIIATGKYLDDLVKCDDGRWRFTRRETVLAMMHPAAMAGEFGDPALAGS